MFKFSKIVKYLFLLVIIVSWGDYVFRQSNTGWLSIQQYNGSKYAQWYHLIFQRLARDDNNFFKTPFPMLYHTNLFFERYDSILAAV